jgi:hypothetical protein
VPQCARHKVETLLSCGRCDKPICPDCAVFGPVGARCRDCASLRSSHVYQVTVTHLWRAAAIGLVVGAASAYALVSLTIGLLGTLWLAFLMGTIGGEALLRACGRKRGSGMEAAAGASVGLGYAAGLALHAATNGAGFPWTASLAAAPLTALVGAAVVVAVVVSRVRFF